jgi:hypothetical protein
LYELKFLFILINKLNRKTFIEASPGALHGSVSTIFPVLK